MYIFEEVILFSSGIPRSGITRLYGISINFLRILHTAFCSFYSHQQCRRAPLRDCEWCVTWSVLHFTIKCVSSYRVKNAWKGKKAIQLKAVVGGLCSDVGVRQGLWVRLCGWGAGGEGKGFPTGWAADLMWRPDGGVRGSCPPSLAWSPGGGDVYLNREWRGGMGYGNKVMWSVLNIGNVSVLLMFTWSVG